MACLTFANVSVEVIQAMEENSIEKSTKDAKRSGVFADLTK